MYRHLTDLIRYSKESCGIAHIGITTNGVKLGTRSTLATHTSPSIEGLVQAGLTSINVSLDTLIPEKFQEISRRDQKAHAKVLTTIYRSLDAGLKVSWRQRLARMYDNKVDLLLLISQVKVNCVLMRGINDSEMENFVQLTKSIPLDVRFIEVMPFDGNNWDARTLISYIEAIDILRLKVSQY